jgi:hypothetical protein
MGKRQTDILAKQTSMLVRERGVQKQPRKVRHVYIRQDLRGLAAEKPGGSQDFELLSPVKLQDSTDAIKHVTADAAVARFQPAQGAVVYLGELGDLLLGQTAFGAQSD